jgi:hypothetical protein
VERDQPSLLKILGIAREHSRVGSGRSLRDLLDVSGYAAVRSHITHQQVQDLLTERPDLAADWVSFSEDKRTSGGWALTKEGGSWALTGSASTGSPHEKVLFSSLAEACAQYVLRELDFWYKVGSSSQDPQLAKLVRETRRLATIFASYSIDDWAISLHSDASLMEAGKLKDGIDHLLSGYGGMGSLNDIFICPEAGHPIPHRDVDTVNRKADALRTSIYEAARALRKLIA